METSLVTHADLAKKFGFDDQTVASVLAKAGVKPVHMFKFGRGYSRLYDPAEATAAVQAYYDAVQAYYDAKRAPPPAEAPAEATAPQEPPKYLAEVLTLLEALDERTTKLLEQNATIFRTLTTLREEVQDGLVSAQLNAALDATAGPSATAPADPTTPTVSGQASKARADKTPKPRVLVVGLLNDQTSMIEKEFRDCLDLRFLRAGAPSQAIRSAAASCDHIACMTGFIDHPTDTLLRKAGATYHGVAGGMTRLRDALTELYVSGAPKPVTTPAA